MRMPELPASGRLAFTCNICGQANELPVEEFHRELGFCEACRSNVRFRGIVHALTTGIFGESRILRDLPPDDRLTGLGFSDADCYAEVLKRRFAYLNTFYDMPPKLDIADPADLRRYMPSDFVICSDVLEHVAPPVERAFANLSRLLKPGGLLVFSVPSFDLPETVEHYPQFSDAKVVEVAGTHVLVNRTPEGEVELHCDLVFHGGPGATLELRLFAHRDVLARLRAAGFEDITVLDQPIAAIGYCWSPDRGEKRAGGLPLGYVISARRPRSTF